MPQNESRVQKQFKCFKPNNRVISLALYYCDVNFKQCAIKWAFKHAECSINCVKALLNIYEKELLHTGK